MDIDPKLANSSCPAPIPTRRETAKRRARTLKVGAAVAASGVFVATATAVHEAHPDGSATSAADRPLTVPTEFAERLAQSDDFGGGGSIGPLQGNGNGMPRTGTHTS